MNLINFLLVLLSDLFSPNIHVEADGITSGNCFSKLLFFIPVAHVCECALTSTIYVRQKHIDP